MITEKLLLQDFLKLVGIAALIAFPLWIFLAAGVMAATVAFLSISYQAIKAALAIW